MRRLLLAAAILALTGAATLALTAADEAAPVPAAAPGTGCRSSPDLVGACFTVHGRLRWHANGRPYL
jgi:hypothetical protein